MPEFTQERKPAGWAKRPLSRTAVVLLILGVAAAVAFLVLFAATTIQWIGSFPVRVVVIQNGKPVPAQAIGSIEYMLCRDRKQCTELLELISHGTDGTDWDLPKAVLDDGSYYIGVRTAGTSYLFGLFGSYYQYHDALVKVTMSDSRTTYLAATIADKDRDQTIMVEAPQADR